MNTAIGVRALHDNRGGSYNVAIGYTALADNRTSTANTAIGGQALLTNRTGTANKGLRLRARAQNCQKGPCDHHVARRCLKPAGEAGSLAKLRCCSTILSTHP